MFSSWLVEELLENSIHMISYCKFQSVIIFNLEVYSVLYSARQNEQRSDQIRVEVSSKQDVILCWTDYALNYNQVWDL
jgi:hypothetical protein